MDGPRMTTSLRCRLLRTEIFSRLGGLRRSARSPIDTLGAETSTLSCAHTIVRTATVRW
ncbi:hypothetical protein CGRA01v4_14458 [Colletotrichum graminicola]|nr:hypothetical protein CGRA01v4_14458 [Colletotrichum graminicola]